MVSLWKIKLFGFLIQDKNLMEYMAEKEKKENKAYTKTAPEFAVKKGVNEIQMIL